MTDTCSRSYVATDTFDSSTPIHRRHTRNPGTRSRSGKCSVSYQSLNSSSAARPIFIAAISVPFAMVAPPLSGVYAGGGPARHAVPARKLHAAFHRGPGNLALEEVVAAGGRQREPDIATEQAGMRQPHPAGAASRDRTLELLKALLQGQVVLAGRWSGEIEPPPPRDLCRDDPEIDGRTGDAGHRLLLGHIPGGLLLRRATP